MLRTVPGVLEEVYYAIPTSNCLFDGRDLIIHDGPLIPWSVGGLALLYGMADFLPSFS